MAALIGDVIANESDATEANEASAEQLSPRGRRILEAIDALSQTVSELQPPRWALPQRGPMLRPRFVGTKGAAIEWLPET